MIKIKIEVDNLKTTVQNSSVGRDHVAWVDVMDLMMNALGSIGAVPSEEALMEYFGIGENQEDMV